MTASAALDQGDVLLERTWRAGILKPEQLAVVPKLAAQAAVDELRSKGLSVCAESLPEASGVAGVLGGFAAGHGAHARIRASPDGRTCRLVVVRTGNAEALAPAPAALASEAAAARAAGRAAEATHAREVATYKAALAAHARALEEHAREVQRAQRAWESGRSARAAKRASDRGLRLFFGGLAGAGGLALTGFILAVWDLGAYYDKVLNTWMVFLVIKILALLVPPVALVTPVFVGSALALRLWRSAAELETAPFSPPRAPRLPSAPMRPTGPTEVGLLHDPERMETLFVKVLAGQVERALAPPSRRRAAN